ncbi:DUF4127 family protein [Paenibacillus gansuensis]|uniref:DUF4127 family protein n=1 Tax=Paenibacillus gansuensis TaxID=306542 RepID=A0ABW5PKL6_9BACL
MKKKIIYVPLDERPCNYDFPSLIAADTDVELVRPPLSWMGNKKLPGRIDTIWEWVLEQAPGAYGAILSMDTLLYGGIVPSRLHSETEQACSDRLSRLRQLKESNPSLVVYAFHLIMRCPRYSSSDEEPDYYGQWGETIFNIGDLQHRLELGLAADLEMEARALEKLSAEVPKEALDDYVSRRAVNRAANERSIELAAEGVIDFMIVPQDDSAPYGWTAKDQMRIRERIHQLEADLDVYMYPGADEAGCTLLARMLNQIQGTKPAVYPRFSSVDGPSVIPLYEDRPLLESLKYQIIAAGGIVASSAAEADLVLLVNSPGGKMEEASQQSQVSLEYGTRRNVIELSEFGEYVLRNLGKPCAVADVAYANGADLKLLRLLRQKNMLFELAGYAGWNTSSNTIGTVLAQSMAYLLYGASRSHFDFLALRLVEDAGYCSSVRGKLSGGPIQQLGWNYFEADGVRGKVSGLVREELESFVSECIEDGRHKVLIQDCWLPWNRMFEVGLKVQYADNDVPSEIDPAG